MSLLKKIRDAVSGIFHRLETEVKTQILPIAIAVTNAVKSITDGDTADIIELIAAKAGVSFPGWEDKLKQVLPTVIKDLALANNYLSLTIPEILTFVLKQVTESSSEEQQLFWTAFSGKVANALADGNLGIIEAFSLADYYYHNRPEPKL